MAKKKDLPRRRNLNKEMSTPYADKLIGGVSVATGSSHRRETLWERPMRERPYQPRYWIEPVGPEGDTNQVREVQPREAYQWLLDNGHEHAVPDEGFELLGMVVPAGRALDWAVRRLELQRWLRQGGDELRQAMGLTHRTHSALLHGSKKSLPLYRLAALLVENHEARRMFARQSRAVHERQARHLNMED